MDINGNADALTFDEKLVGNVEKKVVLKQMTKVKSKSKILQSIYLFCKRFLDIVLSLVGIVCVSPFMLVITILIKKDSKGPVFFKHKRIGKNGKEIAIYKFRTMIVDAEKKIKEFTPEQKKEFEKNYKLNNDPRVTKFGRILRKTSLDELPQLFNILKGELSLIGPRPVIKKELEKYGYNQDKFLSITPGLTGFWAANGRSCTTYDQRMQLELYYVDNVSLILDIKIIFKTIFSVIKRQGAI